MLARDVDCSYRCGVMYRTYKGRFRFSGQAIWSCARSVVLRERGFRRAMAGIGRENAVIAHPVEAGRWDEGS